MTVEEQAFRAALEGDEDLIKELLSDLSVSELLELADTTEFLDEVVSDLIGEKR